MLFVHPERYQWHNDDPYYDGLRMLRNVQIQYLEEKGYINLRCAWVLGCPDEIHPLDDGVRENIHAGAYYKNAFMELFPGVDVPAVVGASCCAQFGTTRQRVLERPRSDYERYREWLLNTTLPDSLSGRIMEYSWHSKRAVLSPPWYNKVGTANAFDVTVILGQDSVYCPTAQDCYCNVFGLCELDCPTADACAGRYLLPPYSNLPQGWPYRGWHGQHQDPDSGLLPEQ